MPPILVNGAQLKCTFGVAPSVLMVLPKSKVMAANMPVPNIMDNIPNTNILPFGMCQTPSNPAVAAATAAALGVLTPMPCVPVTVAPWVPGVPTVLVGNMPALDINCQLICMWGGVIKPLGSPATTVQIP